MRAPIKSLLVTMIAIASLTAFLSDTASAAEPYGVWVRPSTGTQVHFYDCGGKLCGYLAWVKDPKDSYGCGAQLIGDVQEMTPVGDAAFASVVCSQVLEHVPDPWAAVAEMARVLRPGGTLILSVPHLSMLHEVPHDYWRFTCFGLAQLLERAGMQVVSITPTAGVLAFAGHLLSLAWMLTAGSLPRFRRAAWKVNAALLIKLLGRLDRKFGAAEILPCDYVAVARKREP